MRPRFLLLLCCPALGCGSAGPEPWTGPVMTEPRSWLTVDQLRDGQMPPLLDMSFLSEPAWASADPEPLAATLVLDSAPMWMDFPTSRPLYDGEDRFPSVRLDVVSEQGRLVVTAQTEPSDSLWRVLPGTGAVWRESGDDGWSRASFPLDLAEDYFNQVRNCVATFVYQGERVSRTYVQCSQETADLDDDQLGNLAAWVDTAVAPLDAARSEALVASWEQAASAHLTTRPLADLDGSEALAAVFDEDRLTAASTSVGAVLDGDVVYVHPARTRHGLHPYPDAMHHGVYSVSKSLLGTVSLLYLAQQYGDDVFDERIVDHVPGLVGASGWDGVTFGHALNMVTGTQGGEAASQLYEPLVLAGSVDEAIANIAALGDAPEEPGTAFRYASTNTFVLSVAMDNLVQSREGEGVHYLDRLRADVLEPIGAGDLDVLLTRDPVATDRVPLLGFGVRPTLDEAAKLARLLAREGEHDGRQLLSRERTREALGRTGWDGHRIDGRHRYRHGLWSRTLRAGGCRSEAVFMQGHGSNHVVFLESGLVVFRFTDEQPDDLPALVAGAESIRTACPPD